MQRLNSVWYFRAQGESSKDTLGKGLDFPGKGIWHCHLRVEMFGDLAKPELILSCWANCGPPSRVQVRGQVIGNHRVRESVQWSGQKIQRDTAMWEVWRRTKLDVSDSEGNSDFWAEEAGEIILPGLVVRVAERLQPGLMTGRDATRRRHNRTSDFTPWAGNCSLSFALSLQHPLLRKLNVVLTLKEQSFRGFPCLSENILRGAWGADINVLSAHW